MRRKLVFCVIGVIIGMLLSTVVEVLAGTPAGPGTPPASTASYTLEDIYQRLLTGANASQSTWKEPTVSPGTGTMHTLNQIYALAQQVGGNFSAGVPKTGQTTSYATGDDGDLEWGVASPSPRFTDNGNGTVTDNLTGLIWLKNANCAGAARVWATTFTDVAQLNANGTINGNNCGDTSSGGSHQTDWRMPNMRELSSLMTYGQYNPAMANGGAPFTNIGLVSSYWTSTTSASDTAQAWGVDAYDGNNGRTEKTRIGYVWPVRGGPR